MARNVTDISGNNFDVYDSSYALAKTRIKVPPSNMNTYAPGSPKPTKDTLQDHEIYQSEMAPMAHCLAGLNISSTNPDSAEMKFEQNGNDLHGNMKDTHVKYLKSAVALLQAKLQQQEEWTMRRVESLLKEKECSLDELRRVKQQLERSLQEKDHLVMMTKQMNQEKLRLQQIIQRTSEKSDIAPNADPDEKAQMFEEIDRLRSENSSLKKSIDNLTSERSSLRESLSAYENSPGSPNSSLSSASTQAYTKELENLHQVVDGLKSTVLKQRNFLLKFIPQIPSSQGPDSKGVETTLTNQGLMAFVQDTPHFRQGEEGSASPLLELKEPMKQSTAGSSDLSGRVHPNPFRGASPNAHTMAAGPAGVMATSAGMAIPSESHPMAVNLADSDASATYFRPVLGVLTNMYSENVGGLNKLNSPLYGAGVNGEGLFASPSDLYLDPLSDSPQASHNAGMKSTSPKRSSPKEDEGQKGGEVQPSEQTRKISKTEILYRRPPPQVQQAPRSKTEVLAYNPRMRSKLHAESEPVWRPPPPPPLPAGQQAIPQSHWPQELALRSEAGMQSSVHVDPMPVRAPVQSSQHYRPQGWPLYSGSPAAEVNIVEQGVVRTGSPLTPLSGSVCAPDNSTPHVADSPLVLPQDSRQNSDHLCPVCHQDFGSITIEQFQSHILDCFDNENGPEPVLPVDVGPQRVCPMCNTSFGDGMSQSEFEKHVHSHFGEDPGENFELLQP